MAIEVNGKVLRLKHVLAYLENKGYGCNFENLGVVEGDYMSVEFSYPFVWRGVYDEVCFSLSSYGCDEVTIVRNQIMVEASFRDTFQSYKGSYHKYNPETPVNFENDNSEYTDLGYLQLIIEKDDTIKFMLEDMVDKYIE